MEFLKNLNLKPGKILKIAGIALVVVIVVSFAIILFGSTFNSIAKRTGLSQAVSQKMAVYDSAESVSYSSGPAMGLSVRNVDNSIIPPQDGYTKGADAEEYEVTEYSSTIETGNLKNTCVAISGLKVKDYVIFENANEYDQGCRYDFKVAKNNVEEILEVIKNLKPKELSENTYTIKNIIEDYTSETEILEKKLESINKTLENAIKSYDDITKLATRIQDVESLARIIESKINIIERLTQERINTSAQLERILRSKAEQLDRLEYTYFHVNIYENKYIDFESLKDSWKIAIKEFIQDVNRTLQNLTVNLIAVLLQALPFIIYLIIILVVGKYGWKLAKRIWKK